MYKKIFLAFTLLAATLARSQDPRFSQFFSSPLTLNPAFTGKFFGTYRIAGNYRNQWPTLNNAFTTATASIDFHALPDKLPENDNWGIGFLGLSDNAANGAVKFNYGSVSTAYHKGLDENGNHQLGIGFQLTYANMLINTANLRFEDQLTSAGFTGVSSEIFSGATLQANYMDINAGILYNGSTNERNNFYAGISLYHINRPRKQFTGANYNLNPRATLHAGGYFPMGTSTSLHLSALQMFQAGVSETTLGTAIQLNTDPDNWLNSTSLYAGLWYRFNDALIPYLGLEFGDFRLSTTYDFTLSNLRTATLNRGGIEVSLIYIRRPSTDRPVNCPKF